MDRYITRKTLFFFILSWLLFFPTAGGSSNEATEPEFLKGLDKVIERSRADWRIPGVAVGIIKDGRVVFARGFGKRAVDGEKPVDADTVFAIGSSSKAFTSALIAMLIQDGRMTWDDRVIDHLANFRMYDPYVTQELTVRDTLCHRSGLSRGDLVWYGVSLEPAEILSRLRYFAPNVGFRTHFQYQNIMYLAAGTVAGNVAGKSWHELIHERIFKPLAMTRASTSVKELGDVENLAQPHAAGGDGTSVIPYRNIDNMGPAGSINASVNDMLKWVAMLMDEGAYPGGRLLLESSIQEMFTPQTIIRKEGRWALMFTEAQFISYGLGWFLHDFRGEKIVEHGGNIDGMSALVTTIPKHKLGVVILTNLTGHYLPNALRYEIFDRFLGATGHDWNRQYLEISQNAQVVQREMYAQRQALRQENTHVSRPLADYTGVYRDPFYGRLMIRLDEDGQLRIRRENAEEGTLMHWHFDTFVSQWSQPGLNDAMITFRLNHDGEVRKVDIEGLAVFERVGGKE